MSIFLSHPFIYGLSESKTTSHPIKQSINQCPSSDEEETRRNLAHANQMHNIEEKNNQLNILMTKMKAMNNWKQTRLKGTTQKKVKVSLLRKLIMNNIYKLILE